MNTKRGDIIRICYNDTKHITVVGNAWVSRYNRKVIGVYTDGSIMLEQFQRQPRRAYSWIRVSK
jgi:hypothetical protein